MKIEFEFINNGVLVYIKEGILDDLPVFFKTKGQAIEHVKKRLKKWRELDD